MEYELYHHGIKGMKWGVRKDRKNGRSRRPTMVDYSPEVTKKFGRKGPKSGPTDSAIGRTESKNASLHDTQKRINKAVLSNMSASAKLNRDYRYAALNDYPATVRYAKKLPALLMNKNNKQRWASTLNSYMDTINDDVGKISIGKDFFTKHQNDTVDDIINDGTNSVVAYMAINTSAQSSASEAHRRAMGF